jgi:acyl-CoA reductase-like NAD-dependent aldehyde dehydrogenase
MPDRAEGRKPADTAGKTTAKAPKKSPNGTASRSRRPAATAAQRPTGNPPRESAADSAAAAQPAASASSSAPASPNGARLAVRKTYKLFVGGAFPRSESGRSYPVSTPGGELLAHAARASRKDVRDAVKAARGAFGRWSGATAYNRGQVLYRVAEMLEGRADQFAAEIAAAEGVRPRAARDQVAAAIDRWVWYAGWTDKVAQVTGAANPVAGPFVNFSVPEPAGVAGVIAPPESSLLGLVSVVAPVIATGNTTVVVASQDRPLPAITLAEVLATSDVPGGVVNLLTGYVAELAPVLAGHMDVDAIDVSGAGPETAAELERLAAGNLKRVLRAVPGEDWAASPGMRRLTAFLETKTFWHPAGI